MIPAREIGCGCGRLALSVTPGFVVDMTHYPAEFELGLHHHEHANLCIVLDGAFTEWSGRRERVCEAGTLIAKPRAEAHRDRFHGRGARCLNVSVDHGRLAQIQDAFSALNEIRIESDPSLIVCGNRLSADQTPAAKFWQNKVAGVIVHQIRVLLLESLPAGNLYGSQSTGPETLASTNQQCLERGPIVFKAGDQNTMVDPVRSGPQMRHERLYDYASRIDPILKRRIGGRAQNRQRDRTHPQFGRKIECLFERTGNLTHLWLFPQPRRDDRMQNVIDAVLGKTSGARRDGAADVERRV
jgi:hypothetical protein